MKIPFSSVSADVPHRLTPVPRNSLITVVAVTLVATLLCIAFVDRPFSTLMHHVLKRHPVFIWMSDLAHPIGDIAATVFVIIGCALLAGRKFGSVERLLLECSAAVTVADSMGTRLKHVFGRTWTETFINKNPSWIQNGIYGFWPFHGEKGWSSFPSNHTVFLVAPLTILWVRLPRFRWLWTLLATVEITGLLGANYHFISDCIAGGFLGAFAGLLVLRISGDHQRL